MNAEVDVLLQRLDALLTEMLDHLRKMRALLQRDDAEWVSELEKYYVAKATFVEGEKELAVLLRRNENAA